VPTVYLVPLGHQVVQVQQDLRASQEAQEARELMAQRALPEERELQVSQDPQGPLDHRVKLELVDSLVSQGNQVLWG